ncbi:thioredoxin domain-containing protein (plasmid) [Halorussus limi]|uniref:Thioredoxin domain-containing protein n=1 Tax=Halorussus limi TaxID=2938695 RepID=A0A8U0I0C9_9EURY|nr:thioredoxin domain-containing protein [Halorussus limi]UPV76862.1 thioredoxin domain-containing protein [Halorussus limi]
MSNRRKLLGAAGSAFLASLAGCASVIGETADGPETTTDASPASDTTTAGSAASAGTETTADGDATRQNVTDGNATGRNVSEPGATTTADAESLGRVSIDPPTLTVSESLVPATPGRYDYARLGRESADATATLFGNWKCPYTGEFVRQMLGDVIEEFVAPGDVALEFRALSYLGGEPFLGPDAPRAARAGLEVWRTAPERYWRYFASVFENQPPERYEWATADRLVRFAETANVRDTDAVAEALLTGAHREKVKATTGEARRRGVATVPRVATAEKVTAPTVDFAATKRQLRRAVER